MRASLCSMYMALGPARHQRRARQSRSGTPSMKTRLTTIPANLASSDSVGTGGVQRKAGSVQIRPRYGDGGS